MQRQEIEALLPIGDPYLWIDQVVEMSTDRIHAQKHLHPDLDVFRGHYTNFPVFPGALQCECAFQAAAVLLTQTEMAAAGGVPVIARMNNVKFRRMVRPGDTLDIHVELTHRAQRLLHMQGTLKVGGKISCQLQFVATEASSGAAD